jgi:hypothetical protein
MIINIFESMLNAVRNDASSFIKEDFVNKILSYSMILLNHDHQIRSEYRSPLP